MFDLSEFYTGYPKVFPVLTEMNQPILFAVIFFAC